jgi:hypothetical protein
MKHDFPQDYYRFTPEALTELFTMHGMKDISVQEIPNEANVMGYATK